MSVVDAVVAAKEERCESFIHMQNLPSLACRKDIRKFLDGLSVKEGGILLRQHEAFVAFDDPLDVAIALIRNKTSLLGREIQLSVVSRNILPKELFRIAKRKLEFGSKNRNTLPVHDFHANYKRKIRPTPVSKGQKRRAESCTNFCPEEMNIIPAGYIADVESFSWSCQQNKRFIATKRKLNPTSVGAFEGTDNSAVFHPKECYEVKKISFGLQWNFASRDSILSNILN